MAGPQAAYIGSTTAHPGMLTGAGEPTVSIEKMPAAVVGPTTLHTCSFPGTPPHPPTPCAPGSATVFIGKKPALRVGDMSGCGAPIINGAATVFIGG